MKKVEKSKLQEVQYSVECTVFKEYGDNVFCIDVMKTKLYEGNAEYSNGYAEPEHIDGYVSNLSWGIESSVATDHVFADKSPSIGPKSIDAAYYDTLELAIAAYKEIKAGTGEPEGAYRAL